MIRIFSHNLKNIVNCKRFLYPFGSNVSISNRFEYTDMLENAKKTENNKFQELKKYREAEVHLWHAMGFKCINPELLTEEQWKHIYELDAKHQRKKYCRFLLQKMQAKAEKKTRIQEERESKKGNREKILAEREANPHIVYGVGHNTLLLRVNSQTINRWINMKLHMAKLYGQKIVIDCSFEKYMTDLERSKMAKGLKRLYSENRRHIKPLDLHICGVEPNSEIIKNFSGQVPSIMSKSSPTRLHTKCFTEIFPKERLVMLTPDSDQKLDYNFNDIYIIGGIVDFGRSDPLTMAKAKKLGIRSARLPLDNVRMGEGDSRELPMSSAAAFIRECQVNRNLKEIIKKTIYLKSVERKKKEDEKYYNILRES